MIFLGNIVWFIFGGVFIALEYFLASFLLCLTIVGIPFGIQTFKLGLLALWPFGKTIKEKENTSGCLSIFMNIWWIIFGGLAICILHLLIGTLFSITIIGLPFGKQHFKLAGLALVPFGKEIIS
jgi:uncharacterized membrane protein YccF (DUF307 family)